MGTVSNASKWVDKTGTVITVAIVVILETFLNAACDHNNAVSPDIFHLTAYFCFVAVL